MKERQDENWKREVKDGKIAYFHRNGKVLPVHAIEKYRVRLDKLLDDAGGDLAAPIIEEFWKLRSEEMKSTSDDGMVAAWAMEVYELIYPLWEEIERREDDGDDLFSAFGL